tara:strand:- start:128 stop:469 length:342 start_codon:yes stop_codon:yes gene_type:complete
MAIDENKEWHNKNKCVDIQLTINSDGWTRFGFTDSADEVECSEIVLFNNDQDFYISTTGGQTGAPTPFLCKKLVYHTIKGISNTRELSAKGADQTNLLYCRTQSYDGYSLAAG